MNRAFLKRYAWLSIAAAVTTIGLKAGAWIVTGSVGLLSDALESLVNLVAAGLALVLLSIAARPPDEEHMFGHDKAEYFSGGIEGGLIVVAAASILISAVGRLIEPRAIEHVDVGVILSVIASAVNFFVARVLLRAGREHHSLALEADARHLMTDVWTTAGVIVGIIVVSTTKVYIIDPIIGLAVAVHIAVEGFRLLNRSAHGLMDRALPADEHRRIVEVLESYHEEGARYHALRTRRSGGRSFVSLHVLVPGEWTVQEGHELLERIEHDIRAVIPTTSSIFTHLEPIEDPKSWEDVELYRKSS